MMLYGSPPSKRGGHLWALIGKGDPQVFYCMWCQLITSIGMGHSEHFDGDQWIPGGYPACPGPRSAECQDCASAKATELEACIAVLQEAGDRSAAQLLINRQKLK